jgi:hypothetical protein
MAAIWTKEGGKWKTLASSPFGNERDLHNLIAEAPALLPLSGEPSLVIVGSEVPIGPWRADLIAVERSGRVAIIEIKLVRNPEARRSVVSQLLSYAAQLHGLLPTELEAALLGGRMKELTGHTTLVEAVGTQVQDGDFDAAAFTRGVTESLEAGRFRLVLVLDDTPTELVQLVGYLEAMSDRWTIDLIKVCAYKVDGREVLVPQRVDPERHEQEARGEYRPPANKGNMVAGSEDFAAAIETSAEAHRAALRTILQWANHIEAAGLAKLSTYHGKGRMVLLPRMQPDNVGLVTCWNQGGAYMSVWRSVFERKAPKALAKLIALVHPVEVSQGSSLTNFSPEVLAVLTEAYREAAGKE